jgi:nucleotide-binding universal stress UspA family protein
VAFPENVIAAIEPKSGLTSTLESARRFAELFGRPLRIVHVLDAVSPLVAAVLGASHVEKVETRERESVVAAVGAAAKALGIDPVPPIDFVKGDPADALLAATRKDDLLVLGVHGGGFQSYGSTARRVVRAASSPLLGVQERATIGRSVYRKILVAIDLTAPARHALELAADIAKREGATLEAIHVFEGPTRGLLDLLDDESKAKEVTERLKAEAQARLAPVLETVSPAPPLALLDGFHPARRICPYATLGRHDLIVIGSKLDPNRKDMVLGSVADELLALATRDVLVVKSAP